MDEKALVTKFWTHESKTTRTVIERTPEGSDDIVHHRTLSIRVFVVRRDCERNEETPRCPQPS